VLLRVTEKVRTLMRGELISVLGEVSGYHLATISGKIAAVECASSDGKNRLPVWNSLKNKRTALCL